METPSASAGNRLGLNRRNALRLLTAGMAGTWVDGTWLEPGRLSVTRQDVRCNRLPPGLQGLRIGLLADFHFRPDQDAELVAKTLEKVREEKLDLIALAGDFADSEASVLAPLLEILGQMQAAHGVFAVMGNHEFNAIAFHTRLPGSNGFFRARSDKNQHQHAATLNQLSSLEMQDALAWFKTLPVALELDGIRVVHAAWQPNDIREIECGLKDLGKFSEPNRQ